MLSNWLVVTDLTVIPRTGLTFLKIHFTTSPVVGSYIKGTNVSNIMWYYIFESITWYMIWPFILHFCLCSVLKPLRWYICTDTVISNRDLVISQYGIHEIHIINMSYKHVLLKQTHSHCTNHQTQCNLKIMWYLFG
jgi:hypothetical protein